MTVADTVIIELEARTGQYERNLRNADRTATTTTRNITAAFRSLGGALVGLGIGLGVTSIINLTSAWTDLNSRVVNATGSINAGRAAVDRLAQVARRTYSPLEQTAESFLRNAASLDALGVSTQNQLDLTETLNNSLVISAARGDRARQVTEAFSKALALGELRGDELNTVIQNGGRLAQALADSLGVNVNQLRALGAAGKITTRDLLGITSQLEQLRTEADAMPATVTDGFVLLGNSIMQFVGQVDSATGVSSVLAEQIILLADSVEESARRWRDGEVPIVNFIESLVGVADQLGLVTKKVEETREGIELIDGTVDDARQRFADMAAEILRLNGLTAFNPNLPAEIYVVVDALLDGEIGAVDARTALYELGATNPDFGGVLSQLAQLAGQLRVVQVEAQAAFSALAQPSGPVNPRGEVGRSRRERVAREEATAGFVTEQQRLAGLTREQLALEQEIARVKKEAADQSVTISTAEAERLARLRIAAGEARSASGSNAPDPQRFADALDAQQRQLEILREETALRATLNPLVNDYGYALERLKIQQELENEATRAGLALTADRVAAIAILADEYASATVEAAQLEERQQRLRDTVEEWAGIMQNATRSFIDDLIEGKSAAEALGNVLKQIGSQLINLGLNSLLGGSGGGLLGGLISGARANGGPVNGGSTYLVGERGPELFTPSSAGRITSNADLQGGGVTVQMSNDFRGVDAGSVARIEAGLDRLAANIVPTIRREIAVGPKKGRRV